MERRRNNEEENLVCEIEAINPKEIPPIAYILMIIGGSFLTGSLMGFSTEEIRENLFLPLFLSLFFSILLLYLSFRIAARNDYVMLSIYKNKEHTYSINIKGNKIDLIMYGDFKYDAWCKRTKISSTIINIPQLSLLAPEQAQLLIKARSYSKQNIEEWGLIRETSTYPIKHVIAMTMDNMKILKSKLSEIGLEEIKPTYKY